MKRTIIDLIGNTPLVEIRRLNPNPAVTLLAKLEYFNPGGSIKDRAALAMIEAGEPINKAYLNEGEWEVDIAGTLYPAEVSLRALYDPKSERVRG